MHTTPEDLFSILLPGIVGCAIEVVETEDQEAMGRKVSTTHRLGDTVASEPVTVDHGDQLARVEYLAQITVLARVHSHVVDVLEKPWMSVVLCAPACSGAGQPLSGGLTVPKVVSISSRLLNCVLIFVYVHWIPH